MSEPELIGAVNDAMSDLGLTLTRQEPSAYERALAMQLMRRVTKALSTGANEEAEALGPWWVAGAVITRDDQPVSIEVQGEFGSAEERRRYMAALCALLNRSGPLLD